MRTRSTALLAGILLVLIGPTGTAAAAPATPAPVSAKARGGYAAPTMLYCKLRVRKGATTSSRLLWTMHNRNGNCPGSHGYDTIKCWLHDCSGKIKGGSYACTTGGARHRTWLPVRYFSTHQRVWVPIKCGNYVLP